MSDFLFNHRESLSALATATLMLMLLASGGRIAPRLKHPETVSAPIELMLEAPQEVKSAPEPEVVPPQLLPRAVTRKSAVALPKPKAAVDSAKEILTPAKPVDDRINTAAAVADTLAPAIQAEPAPASPPPAMDAAPPPSPLAPIPENHGGDANAEAAYVGKVRAHLQASKRYPTGREASLQRPAGTAAIWFTLRRNGELAGAGVDASSGSMLLDNAALATVRRSSYPAYPDEAWPGKEQQRFTVELDFVPMN